jgi:hypothetical protein
MKVIIEIEASEKDLKVAIALGWNKRFDEQLTYKDIKEVSNKEDIIGAIPYLDNSQIEIEVDDEESNQ